MKILVALIYAIKFTYTAAYIYGGYPKRDSIAIYEPHRPDDIPFKYNAAKAGYKLPDRSYPVKVKKESHTSGDYQNYVAAQDSSSHSSPVLSSGYNADYSDGDGGAAAAGNSDGDYSTSSTPSTVNQQWNLYANRENYDSPHKLYVPFSTTTTPSTTTLRAAAASHKIFVQPDDDPNLYYHNHLYRHPNQNVVVAKPTHVAKPQHHVVEYKIGHQLDDILHSKVLDKPLIQKLSLAKVALIQLVSLLSSLSAIKTIHVVAKASHHSEPISNHIEPPLPGPNEYADKPHYPHTLAGMILHFVAQLSRFNIEAKKNLIPNLLRVAGYASASSSRTSAHKTR